MLLQNIGDGEDVLIATAGEVDDQHLLQLRIFTGHFQAMGQGMGGFQGWNDPFMPSQLLEGVQRLLIGDGDIFGTPSGGQVGVLRADGGEVEPAEME